MLILYGDEIFTPSGPSPSLEDNPLSAVHYSLFHVELAASLQSGRECYLGWGDGRIKIIEC
jgi:hypothetical protein